MTHEELLKKVSPKIQLGTDYPSWDALRAVVELHKPANDGFNWYPTFCSKCSSKAVFSPYPCPTIQVIEKELM